MQTCPPCNQQCKPSSTTLLAKPSPRRNPFIMSAVTTSTSTPQGSHLGAVDLEKYGLPYLQSALTSYRPEAEILFSIAMSLPYLARTTSFSSPKRARAR